MKNIKELVPGLIFVAILSLVSIWINGAIESHIKLEAVTIGIIIGIIYNNTIGTSQKLLPGATFSLKKLLKAGIVLLGFIVNINAMIELGPRISLVILVFVPSVLVSAMYLGKKMGVDRKVATLLGVGSCICGASAVVALAPCIKARDEDAVIAVSIVNLLGAAGVLLYSSISLITNMSDIQYGVWSGLSLQGVAHALAAAFARGAVAGNMGTLVKMERVIMLVPVSIALGVLFNREEGEGEGKGRGVGGEKGKSGNTPAKKNRATIPGYLLWFIGAVIIQSLGIIPPSMTGLFTRTSSFLILMAMVGMGLSVNLQSIKEKGLRALMAGSLLFTLIASSTFIMVNTLV